MTHVAELRTPALLLDLDILERNIAWMANRARTLGVALRPHVKTHKCREIAERQQDLGSRGITVATLQEARDFAAHGFDDITWAFPVVLGRIDEAVRLAHSVTLRFTIDSIEAIDALEKVGHPLHVWLKVDCGYHRAGVDPSTPHAVALATRLAGSSSLEFNGLLTHAGHTYDGPSKAESAAAATEERDTMLEFAAQLRAAGIEVPGISVGSTPGMRAIDHLDGITEARPGNYVFYDYTQVTLGTCAPRECAVTVLASVVSSQPGRDHCVIDAGALALSKDPGRGGLPSPTMGEIFSDYAGGSLHDRTRVVGLSQEHGRVTGTFRVGERVRILPNHSCLTAACFDEYQVVLGEEVVDRWKIWRER